MTATYTGELRRGEEPGTVAGWIQDAWGWRIAIVGTLQPGGGYSLSGTLGDVPDALRVAAVDGVKPP